MPAMFQVHTSVHSLTFENADKVSCREERTVLYKQHPLRVILYYSSDLTCNRSTSLVPHIRFLSKMQWICASFFVLGLLNSMCLCDESLDEAKEYLEDAAGGVKKTFDDTIGDFGKSFDVGESMKGVGDFFKNAAGGLKEKSEDGIEAMKGMSETGVEAAKGFADGIGDRFAKAKDKLQESGEKVKETFLDAADKTKGTFETAASKLSNHAREASGTIFSLLG